MKTFRQYMGNKINMILFKKEDYNATKSQDKYF